MPSVEFEHTISAGERPQTYVLDLCGHWDRQTDLYVTNIQLC